MTKVRRLSDGKVFSSPRGVALESGQPIAKAVSYCCKGYILAVEGISYEWYYDEEGERGKQEHTDSYWERRGRWKSRAWVLMWRASFVKDWMDATPGPESWRRVTTISEGICRVAEKSDQKFKWLPTAQNLSKHLHAYKEFYEAAFGMVEQELNVPAYKGRIYKFLLGDSDPDLEAVINELANSREWGTGKPVIRTSDNERFPSMTVAEKITGVPYYLIYHCCEGDIDHCKIPLTGERMEFRYATEINS
ncbi:hypothetical protein KA005_45645 [bacterium]|nr:hypothetical protein [bacterium]